MIAARPPASSARTARAAAGMPSLGPDSDRLTVRAYPAPPDAIVLAVRGAVDVSTSPLLRDHLLARLRDKVPQVIVDLTGVRFLSAAGLTALVTAVEVAVAEGIKLCVIASTRPVLLPLTITGLDGVFDISPDLTRALRRAGSPDG